MYFESVVIRFLGGVVWNSDCRQTTSGWTVTEGVTTGEGPAEKILLCPEVGETISTHI